MIWYELLSFYALFIAIVFGTYYLVSVGSCLTFVFN